MMLLSVLVVATLGIHTPMCAGRACARVAGASSAESSRAGALHLRPQDCAAAWRGSGFRLADAEQGWRSAGRTWVTKHSNVAWNDTIGEWTPISHKVDGFDVAQNAYYLEYALAPAAHLAEAAKDVKLVRELSDFYLAHRSSFARPADLRGAEVELRDIPGLTDSLRILPSVGSDKGKKTIGECELCSAQFLYSAARLLRAATELEPTPDSNVREFARTYTPIIVQDHIVRWIRHVNRNYWRAPGLDSAYLEAWRQLATLPPERRNQYRYSVRDNDLWIIATAAEVLVAHHRAPALVPLSRSDEEELRSVVRVGVQLMRSRMRLHSDTRDFAGRQVTSLSLFDGEFDDYPDVAFSADSGSRLPTGTPRRVQDLGWDVSHATRIPQVLRTLVDTRAWLGVPTFSSDEIRLLDYQFAYRAFKGDMRRPMLNNYLDGTDGWNRVGYHGQGYGFPPSRYCDSRNGMRPCLQTTAFTGWGLLASASPDVCRIERAVVEVALAPDSASREFAARYFTFNGEEYSWRRGDRSRPFPFLLFWMLADNAEYLSR